MLDKYDHVIIIKSLENIKNEILSFEAFKEVATHNFNLYMKNRLISIHFHDKTDKLEYIIIGMILNQDRLQDYIEKGPKFGSEEAVEFKNLWGDLSKVTQRNGTIHECVVWPEKGNLTLKIVDFIMKEKLGFMAHGEKGGWHQIYSEQLNKFVKEIQTRIKNKKENLSIKVAYDLLNNKICVPTAGKNVKSLPVHIIELRPIGGWYKSTNIFPDRCISVNGFNVDIPIDQINRVYTVALIAEANNRWPSDINEFQIMAKLFIAKLSEKLYKDCEISSKVLEDGKIDIYIKGFIFRCFLDVKKEAMILKRLETEIVGNNIDNIKRKRKLKPSLSNCLKENSKDMSKELRKHLLTHDWLMDMNTRIRCLCVQFGQVMIDCCRLAKRWFVSQGIELIADDDDRLGDSCLDGDESNDNPLNGWCFSELAVELIVASLFIQPSSEYFGYPRSAVCGFIRFLKLMSEFDWCSKPLVVNINSLLSADRFEELSKPFTDKDNRFTELPSAVIRTPVDEFGNHWTTIGPNRFLLDKVKNLTKQAYFCCEHLLISRQDLKPIFTLDSSDLDVLIHLKSSLLDLYLDKSIDVTQSEINRMRKNNTISIVSRRKQSKFQRWPKDYNDCPVETLTNRIRAIVGNQAVCFVDKFGPRFIGLKWLKREVDREFIIKCILAEGQQFVAKCEVLE